MGLFDKLKQGLQRTTQQLKDRFDDIVNLADAPEARTRSTSARVAGPRALPVSESVTVM